MGYQALGHFLGAPSAFVVPLGCLCFSNLEDCMLIILNAQYLFPQLLSAQRCHHVPNRFLAESEQSLGQGRVSIELSALCTVYECHTTSFWFMA